MKALVVGLTGGIATGKSTVLEMLRRLGAGTLSCDAWVRELLSPGGACVEPVRAAFGDAAIRDDGGADREFLAARIFRQAPERRRLEEILHPPVFHRLRDAFARIRQSDRSEVLVAEIPLLFETGAETMVDRVLVVHVEQPTQFQRLKDRTHWPDELILAAVSSQMPLADKARRADWVIDADGPPARTEQQVRCVWKQLIHLVEEASSCR